MCRIANSFVVCVVNEGGCIDSDTGCEYKTAGDAIKAAKKIKRKEVEHCFNCGGHIGVNVDVYACDDDSEIGGNFIDNGILIFSCWV